MKVKSLFFFMVLCLCTVGCGGDEDIDVERTPVSIVSVDPPGGYLPLNGTITVTFDGEPKDVTVSEGFVLVAGNTATITGPFSAAIWLVGLTITWADGTGKLIYTIEGIFPDCCGDMWVTGGTVKDGDKDVDPEVINTDGIIVIEFSEDVSGHIALQTEGGDDVGWIGKVEGNKGTLELVKGRELENETTYVIRGKVADAAGNSTDVSVTFVTQAKE